MIALKTNTIYNFVPKKTTDFNSIINTFATLHKTIQVWVSV